MIDITICDRRMTLMNIYAPNKDDPSFINDLIEIIETTHNDDRILGGDFNCILLNHMDKKGGAEAHANHNMSNVLSTYMEESDLVDIWRKQHLEDKQFTFHCKIRNEFVFSRLDFFLVSFGLSNLVESSNICPSILTDHSLIKLNIILQSNKRGPGFWKFNCSLLHDVPYVNMIKKTITDTVEIEQGHNSGLLWETIKLNIRTETIRFCAQKKT